MAIRQSGLRQVTPRRVGDSLQGSSSSSGGGAALWFSNVGEFARTVVGTLIAAPFVSECTSLVNDVISLDPASGTGSVTLSTTDSGGVIIPSSGATAGGFRTAFAKGDTAEATIPNLRTTPYAIATRAKITALGADFNVLLCTVGDHATGALGIFAHHSVSATNYSLEVFASTQDSGVALDVTNQRTYLVVADGTTVRFYIGNADGTGMTTLFSAGLPQSAAGTGKGIWLTNSQNVSANAAATFKLDAIMQMTQAAG